MGGTTSLVVYLLGLFYSWYRVIAPRTRSPFTAEYQSRRGKNTDNVLVNYCSRVGILLRKDELDSLRQCEER